MKYTNKKSIVSHCTCNELLNAVNIVFKSFFHHVLRNHCDSAACLFKFSLFLFFFSFNCNNLEQNRVILYMQPEEEGLVGVVRGRGLTSLIIRVAEFI